MGHVQDNAEESVRRVLDVLKDGHFEYEMDSGATIAVTISIDKDPPPRDGRFHRHERAAADQLQRAVRGVQGGGALRVPHAGRRRHPDECRLPEADRHRDSGRVDAGAAATPAAVVAGNVETSQAITDTLYGALGVLAASQGTMNNFTFGNARYQYYETISGGSGAGPDFDGASVVQTHMTNSRLTDPEVLEWRFPVRLESYANPPRQRRRGPPSRRRRRRAARRFLEPMTAVMLANHRRIAPFGVAGGLPGAVGRNWVERLDRATAAERVEFGATFAVSMKAGDVFVVETPGGGGFGPPEEATEGRRARPGHSSRRQRLPKAAKPAEEA
jgi:5-oxoprolinase (ATP-hydrolysing)